MKITAAMLLKAGACSDQVKVFRKAWPKGATVNLRNARRATKLELNMGRAARNLLSAPARSAFDAATAQAFVDAAKIRA